MNPISLLFYLFAVSAISNGLDFESIKGGDEASEGQFPYQIYLDVHSLGYCGGAILSENFVLTAAHCVINETSLEFFPVSFLVYFNILNFKNRTSNFLAVDKIYTLYSYDPEFHTNDIALLKLDSPLELTKNKLQAIKLPSINQTYAGVKAVISGYGWDRVKVVFDNKTNKYIDIGSSHKVLKFAAVNVLMNSECKKRNYPASIPSTKICGRVVQRGINNKYEGICGGDSGSPLVYNDIVIGVVSTSPFGCNETTKAAPYTRVSSFLPFIRNVMRGRLIPNVRPDRKLTSSAG